MGRKTGEKQKSRHGKTLRSGQQQPNISRKCADFPQEAGFQHIFRIKKLNGNSIKITV
jgi:hypothetical protein